MQTNQLQMQLESLLKTGKIDSPRFEAAQIADFAKGDKNLAEQLVLRRIKGEPLQYLLGEWEFYGLPLYVGPGVLIPRADTEILVDAALQFLKTKPAAQVADLCAGSGCIGLAIQKNAPGCSVTAVEKSPEAFRFLQKNIARLGCDVHPVQADITAGGFGTYDLVVSNPPYICTDVLHSLQTEVQQEPRMALDGGDDGLHFYRAILQHWLPCIRPGGALMVEIGYDQAAAVTQLFINAGLAKVQTLQDYGKNDRVILGTLL